MNKQTIAHPDYRRLVIPKEELDGGAFQGLAILKDALLPPRRCGGKKAKGPRSVPEVMGIEHRFVMRFPVIAFAFQKLFTKYWGPKKER